MKELLLPDWKMIREEKAYFQMLRGVPTRRSTIESETPGMVHSLNDMVRKGEIVGQSTFISKTGLLNSDIIYQRI